MKPSRSEARIGLGSALLLVVGLSPLGAVQAQPAGDTPAAAASAPKTAGKPADRKKRAPRVLQLEALKVSGQVQKPEAFYILQRSELDFKGLEPKKSFVPLILKSVEKDPF